MAAPGAEKRDAAAAAAPAAPAKETKKSSAPKTAGVRKSKDKWKAKEWYQVHAPRMFNETVIGETPSADPDYLIGRQAEVTVQDLTGDFSKMHIKLKFKIVETDGHEAKTELIGHDLTSSGGSPAGRRPRPTTSSTSSPQTASSSGSRPCPSPTAGSRPPRRMRCAESSRTS